MKKQTTYILILAAAFIWGTIGYFVRTLGDAGFSNVQLISLRCLISAAIMVVFLFFYDRRLLHVRLKDLWLFVGTGIISFVSFTLCYFSTIAMTSLSVAAILLYTAPIFVTLLSALIFRTKLGGRTLVCLAMAFAGCVLVSGFSGSSETSTLGIFLGLMSGFLYGLYSIFGQLALRRYSSLTIIAYTFVFASAGISPFCDFSGIAQIGWTVPVTCMVIFFAAASGAAAYLLYTLGLARIHAADASITAIAEPVIAALTGAFVFGETLSAAGIAGIGLVIAAILLLSLWASKTASSAT